VSTNTSWANRGKAAIAATPTAPLKTLKSVSGGGERIIAFYRFTEPKKPNELSRILTPGQVVEGVYAGSFQDPKYKKYTHKVKTSEGLVGLPGAAQLDKAMAKVKVGADVRVEYNGMNELTKGPFAGKAAHTFSVAASETNE
jgi:hypothetical protein